MVVMFVLGALWGGAVLRAIEYARRRRTAENEAASMIFRAKLHQLEEIASIPMQLEPKTVWRGTDLIGKPRDDLDTTKGD